MTGCTNEHRRPSKGGMTEVPGRTPYTLPFNVPCPKNKERRNILKTYLKGACQKWEMVAVAPSVSRPRACCCHASASAGAPAPHWRCPPPCRQAVPGHALRRRDRAMQARGLPVCAAARQDVEQRAAPAELGGNSRGANVSDDTPFEVELQLSLCGCLCGQCAYKACPKTRARD